VALRCFILRIMPLLITSSQPGLPGCPIFKASWRKFASTNSAGVSAGRCPCPWCSHDSTRDRRTLPRCLDVATPCLTHSPGDSRSCVHPGWFPIPFGRRGSTNLGDVSLGKFFGNPPCCFILSRCGSPFTNSPDKLLSLPFAPALKHRPRRPPSSWFPGSFPPSERVCPDNKWN